MILNRPVASKLFAPILVNEPVYLRVAGNSDFRAWTSLREDSREHLVRWEQNWTPEDMTESAFRRRLRHYREEAQRCAGMALLAFRIEDDALVGGATLTQVRFGFSRCATLGYWIGAPFVRRGFGRAMVAAVVDHAIEAIGLNRVGAACHPDNVASQRTLSACGFTREGLARDYLKINGVWCDHEIYAITAADLVARAGMSPC